MKTFKEYLQEKVIETIDGTVIYQSPNNAIFRKIISSENGRGLWPDVARIMTYNNKLLVWNGSDITHSGVYNYFEVGDLISHTFNIDEFYKKVDWLFTVGYDKKNDTYEITSDELRRLGGDIKKIFEKFMKTKHFKRLFGMDPKNVVLHQGQITLYVSEKKEK